MSHSVPPDDRPLVSIVVTSFQQGALLAETVRSAVGQSHPRLEVIVVDDGSGDGSPEVARASGATRVIVQAHRGAAAARNAGLAAATGEYVVFLDGDDRLHPQAVERQLAELRRHPQAAFVIGRNRHIDVEGHVLGTPREPRRRGDMYEALLRRAWICPPSALLVRRTAVLDVGGWSEQLTNAEDLDLYLRLARAHQGIDHTDVVTDYRLHRGMKSRSYRKGLEGNLRALSEHPPVGAEPHLLRARQQGERHYQRAYGRKVVLTAWTDSLRSRRNVRDATRDLTRLLLTDLHGVLALVLRSSSRRTRVAWRRRAATWRMRGARLLRPSAPGRRRRGGNNPAG